MNEARVQRLLIALTVFLVAIQIFQPARTNPPVVASRGLIAHVPVPEDVHSSLMRACGDCHSNRTRWSWYSHIAPLSWVITDDVNQGRRNMNFDDWEAQESPQKADEHLADTCKEVREKGMPPFSYRQLHEDLRLKPEEISSLCAWSQSFRGRAVAP